MSEVIVKRKLAGRWYAVLKDKGPNGEGFSFQSFGDEACTIGTLYPFRGEMVPMRTALNEQEVKSLVDNPEEWQTYRFGLEDTGKSSNVNDGREMYGMENCEDTGELTDNGHIDLDEFAEVVRAMDFPKLGKSE